MTAVTTRSSRTSAASARSAAATADVRLRAVLRVNAATSTLAAVVALVAPGPVSDALGGVDHTVVSAVGVALLAFALGTALVSRRDRTSGVGTGALVVSVGDVAWVVATPFVLAATDPTTTGVVVAMVMAVGVAAFATAQLALRHRLTRAA